MAVNSEEGLSLDPLFKWPGGKRWFVRRHRSFLDFLKPYRLVEPFAGALALSLSVAPKKALISDTNPLLMNFYQQIQKKSFILDPSFCSKEEYYQLRSQLNQAIIEKRIYSLEIAKIFWRLNRWGFNGLCRFNRQGIYNVPYGDNKVTRTKDLTAYHDLMQDWKISVGDFEKLALEDGDFLFCDPPYDHGFQHYSGNSFSFEDQQRLVSWLNYYTGPVILMNHATKRIVELYRDHGYRLILMKAPRFIGSNPKSRQLKEEILAYKNFSWQFDGKEIQY